MAWLHKVESALPGVQVIIFNMDEAGAKFPPVESDLPGVLAVRAGRVAEVWLVNFGW